MKQSLTSDLKKALREDEGFYFSWQSNIAMAFFDEMNRNDIRKPNRKVLLKIANTAAKNFLKLLIKK